MEGYAKPYDFVDRITNIQNINDVDESACDVANSALGEGIDLTNNAKVSIQFLKNLLLWFNKFFFRPSVSVRFSRIFGAYWKLVKRLNDRFSNFTTFFYYRYQFEAVDAMKRNLNLKLMVMGVDLLWVEPGCLMDIIGSNFRTCMRSVKHLLLIHSNILKEMNFKIQQSCNFCTFSLGLSCSLNIYMMNKPKESQCGQNSDRNFPLLCIDQNFNQRILSLYNWHSNSYQQNFK